MWVFLGWVVYRWVFVPSVLYLFMVSYLSLTVVCVSSANEGSQGNLRDAETQN